MKDSIVAYHCLYDQCEDVVPNMESELSKELPGELIVAPGNYKIFGRSYSLVKEGLYRFIRPFDSCEQRIVWGGQNVDDVISAISWITMHGVQDEHLSVVDKTKKALHSKISCSCGYVSLWASSILDSIGVKSRCVSGLTLDDWNSYNNGHTMIEVYTENENKWSCYDIDNHVMFLANSIHLDFCEVCNAVCNGREYELRCLSSAAVTDSSYEGALYFDKISGEANLRKWYKRVLQVPLIRHKNSKYYFCDQKNRKRVRQYSKTYKFINESSFKRYFY